MNSNKIKIIKGVILEETGRQKEAIALVNKELKKKREINPSVFLALKLIQMISYYDLREYEKCNSEFFSLIRNATYADLYEYGFLLRNAELVLSYKESLPYFQESTKVFEKFGDLKQAAISRITYGVHLGLIGKLNEAAKQLRIAKSELADFPTYKHVVLNNQAVVLLFQKDSSNKVAELLAEALITANLDFDKVVILINYLVLMDWRNEDTKAIQAISSIEKILVNPSFADKEIIRYAYFDIYKYYERKMDNDLAIIYRNKIDSLRLPITPIWDFFLNGKPIPVDDKEYFRSTINRAISYISCWTIDADSILKHYK